MQASQRGGVQDQLRVWVEIMGSQKSIIVGKSQSVLIMVNPIIFIRTREHTHTHTAVDATTGSRGAAEGGGRTCICRWRIRLCRAAPTASRASGSATPCPLSEHARRAGGKLSVGRRVAVSWGGMFSCVECGLSGMFSYSDCAVCGACCVRAGNIVPRHATVWLTHTRSSPRAPAGHSGRRRTWSGAEPPARIWPVVVPRAGSARARCRRPASAPTDLRPRSLSPLLAPRRRRRRATTRDL
eukprot:COSAG01_NODE_4148_length_5295_cov_7.400115_5_plen_241_part_00